MPAPLRQTLPLLAALAVLAGCDTGPSASALDPSAAIVTYSFDVSSAGADLAPSSPLVAEIARDPNLGRLTVKADSAGQGLEAEYAFGSVAEFQAWRAESASLIERVAALSPDTVTFSPRLSVRRPALYQSIVGDLANGEAPPVNVTYQTSGNEAGGGGTGEGVGDAGDIDAVTLVCVPGLAGTIEECKASN